MAIDKNFKIKNGLTVGDVEIVSSTGEWVGPSTGLVGPPGADGNAGANGMDGADGLSAYQVAVNNGFVGTEQDWINGLVTATSTHTLTNKTLSNPSITGITSFTDTTDAVSSTAGSVTFAGGIAVAQKLYVGSDARVNGNLTIDGNFTVSGTTTTLSATNLAVSDNMIYMNQAISTTVTNVVGNGSTVVYTTEQTHNYLVGYSVSITGVTPTSYNLSNQTITAVTSNTFTVANAATGTYVSGGIARGKSNSNPDLGIAAGYNDGSYAHTGFFRDATDGYWKVFKGYTPEPDASVFIDTAHASFALADIQAANFRGNVVGTIGGKAISVVSALPGSPDTNTIYFVTG